MAPVPAALSAQQLSELAGQILQFALAAHTQRAYAADWRHFSCWCADRDRKPLPATADTLILYLTDLALQVKFSTLQRRLASISRAHHAAGMLSPAQEPSVKLFVRALRRRQASQPIQGSHYSGKRPLLAEQLTEILAAIPQTHRGIRDRAVLLVGFLGALRRSEIVSLQREDVEFVPAGVILHLRRSKNDPLGTGYTKGLPRGPHPSVCPAAALEQWIRTAGIRSGPLFPFSGRTVARLVKKYAAQLGLPAAEFSGHSLRAGLATSAAMAKQSEYDILRQTGHASATALRRYIRDGSLFRSNAAAGLLSPPFNGVSPPTARTDEELPPCAPRD